MDGRVLGPVSVERTGGKRAAGTTKVAALFALLVTSPGYRCSREKIVEALWEGKDGKENQLAGVIKELRKILGDEAVPHSGKSGMCTLRLSAESVDYLRFLEGWRQALPLPYPERFERIRAALEEYTGDEPLQGLRGSAFRERRERLRAERIEAVCDLLDAAWMAREAKRLREESEKWHKLLPGHQKIFRYYLLAHYADMRSEAFDRLISRWQKRYGNPEPELQDVIDRLRGAPSRPEGTVLPPIPAQLPGGELCPIGREDLVRDLADFVREEQNAGRTAFVQLSGMAGVGKTVTGLHLAWQLSERFPDGVFYQELNGFTGDDVQPAEPEQVLDGFLANLPPYFTVTGLRNKSTALRSALAHRSVLIVLDDARDTEQVLPLLPGPGTCAVIITSRDELGGLRAQRNARVRSYKVGPLREEDALKVLQERVAEKDRSKRAGEFAELARLCGYLPLALAIVARQLEGRPPRSLAREMKEERARLEALHMPEHQMSVLVAFGCSVRGLSAEARLLLWQLALHPGPSIGWEAVMDIGVASEGARTDRALTELVEANLVEFQSDRYRLHDLVRAFARQHLRPDSSQQAAAIERRTLQQVLEHQVHNVRACDRMLDGQRTLRIGEPGEVRVIEPGNLEDAMEVLDKEYETVQHCITLASDHDMDRYTWLLPMALVNYQWRRRRLRDALNNLGEAREAAERIASPVERAMVYRMLAGTRWRLGNFGQAAGDLLRAVHLSEQDDSADGRWSLARSLYALGITLRKQGEVAAAETALRRALELFQGEAVSDPVGEAESLNALGALLNDRGEHDRALPWCTRALEVIGRTEEHRVRADVSFTLAKVRLARAERDEGMVLFHEAAGIYREQEHWSDEDKVRCLLADALISAGRTQEAVEELERAFVLRERMGGEGAQEIRERLEGLR
ncbi:NB-ARC domain-containing protein [Streptomyces sp. NPDC048717]|uniref:NB-ARC domain-containing protein n=1 Tax=Streptomyces sp. NPDC048717 TaxID=3154928 RepID=UPI00342C6AA1